MSIISVKYHNRNFNPRSPWGERPSSCCCNPDVLYFNPRSPWGERQIQTRKQTSLQAFQSTLPVGGATYEHSYSQGLPKFQSTLPVGGATPVSNLSKVFGYQISIHAPRGGSDFIVTGWRLNISYFNPRSPWGERPACREATRKTISDFNPRSPWGERPTLCADK